MYAFSGGDNPAKPVLEMSQMTPYPPPHPGQTTNIITIHNPTHHTQVSGTFQKELPKKLQSNNPSRYTERKLLTCDDLRLHENVHIVHLVKCACKIPCQVQVRKLVLTDWNMSRPEERSTSNRDRRNEDMLTVTKKEMLLGIIIYGVTPRLTPKIQQYQR